MDETRSLLMRWHAGDQEAMAALVQAEREFVATQIRRRLGPQLRQQHDTQDIVQETLLNALRSAPRFLLSDRNHLRSLLVRMVENTMRSAAVHLHRQKRDLRRERPLALDAGDTVIDLDPAATITDPGDAAARDDLRAWVRLAIELLPADDREVVLLRDYEELTFAEIGERLGEAEDTVRMRHRRALPRLAATLTKLRQGRLGELLEP